MNKKVLEQIKVDLLERQSKLEAELAKLETPDASGEAAFPQFGDKEDENAAEVATYSDNLSLEESLRSSLQDVIKAIKRIDEGTYGQCSYCHQPIDEKRLLARPASSACVACKNRLTKLS